MARDLARRSIASNRRWTSSRDRSALAKIPSLNQKLMHTPTTPRPSAPHKNRTQRHATTATNRPRGQRQPKQTGSQRKTTAKEGQNRAGISSPDPCFSIHDSLNHSITQSLKTPRPGGGGGGGRARGGGAGVRGGRGGITQSPQRNHSTTPQSPLPHPQPHLPTDNGGEGGISKRGGEGRGGNQGREGGSGGKGGGSESPPACIYAI